MLLAMLARVTPKGLDYVYGLCWLMLGCWPVAFFIMDATRRFHGIWPAIPVLTYSTSYTALMALAGMLAFLRLAWRVASGERTDPPRDAT